MINGESRPLDVPPIIWQGNVLVPIRVISEGMGAYVQWVPDKQLVVVRYLPATPPPAPVATAAPAVVATPPPTPTPAPKATPYKDLFVAGDYILSPKVYNEFSPGNTGKSGSYAVRGAFEFDAFNLPWMIEGSFQQFQYPHNADLSAAAPGESCAAAGALAGDPGCVTSIGGANSTYVNAFSARDADFDGRLALRVANPRIYVGIGYIMRTNNYGYPQETGVGFGAEKLPDLDQHLSVFGSAWYYPNLKGNYTDGFGNEYDLAYRTLKYQAGLTYVLGNSPVFIEAGYLGETGQNKSNAPSNYSDSGPFVGLGIKF
jgi:hypothetical protein